MFSHFGPSIHCGVSPKNCRDKAPFQAQSLKQVHGDHIVLIENYGPQTEGDAMVSKEKKLRLLIKTADCIPLLLADEEAGVIAAVHAGWRGLVQEIVPKTIEYMLELGAKAPYIKVGAGPSLGLCCSRFSEPHQEIPERYHWAIQPNKHVDLKQICQKQLEACGVKPQDIQISAICTACSRAWFSWRRDRDLRRFGSWIEQI